MRHYELVVILSPLLNQDQTADTWDRIKGLITTRNGEITHEEKWGIRRLAYPIHKGPHHFMEGSYHLTQFSTERPFNGELDSLLRLDDQVLRSLLVVSGPPKPAPALPEVPVETAAEPVVEEAAAPPEDVVETAAEPVVAEAAAPPKTRRKRTPAPAVEEAAAPPEDVVETAAEPVVEEAAAPPKTRRKRAPAPAAEEATVPPEDMVETAAEPVVEEAAAPPKTRRKRAAAPPEDPVGDETKPGKPKA